jgi:hypothetical protein
MCWTHPVVLESALLEQVLDIVVVEYDAGIELHTRRGYVAR